MLHADGELQPAEAQALVAFVSANPELREEFEAYGSIKLMPDAAVVYTNKEALLKPVPAKRIVLSAWQRLSIAASVAAIIFISLFNLRGTGNEVAINETEPAAIISSLQPAVQTPAVTTATPAATNEVAAIPEVPATEMPVSKKPTVVPTHVPGHLKAPLRSGTQDPAMAQAEQYEINKIAVTETQEYVLANAAAPLAVIKEIPGLAIALPAAEHKSSILDNLPIEDIKKDGIALMANAVANTYRKMDAFKHSVTDEKNITVRIEKKRLVLSF